MPFSPDPEPPRSEPEERFGELFKAARVLLKERVDDEDRIIPTLVAAEEISRGTKRWVDLKEEVLSERIRDLRRTTIVGGVRVTKGPRNLRVVQVADGILVLERVPISAEAVRDLGTPVPPGSWRPPSAVLIRVYPHKRAATADEAASVYEEVLSEVFEEVLSEKRMPRGKGKGGSIEYEFTGKHLLLTVRGISLSRTTVNNIRPKSGFPPPGIVGKLCRPLLEEFGEQIVTRKRGGGISGAHLVPACVAFFLRTYGRVEGGKELHRLLNDHVFEKKRLPEEGLTTSEVTHLRQNIKKASEMIRRTTETF